MDLRLVVALQALKEFCEERGVKITHNRPDSSEHKNIFILRTSNNKFGSMGIGPDNELRFFCRDNKKYRWAKIEGFKDRDIYEKLGDELLDEVTLEGMAQHFTGK